MISYRIPDDVLRTLRAEFLVDAGERLKTMQRALDALGAGDDPGPMLLALRREAHNLKGMGGSFGLSFITLVAHRLEDYLGLCRFDRPADSAHAQAFLDCLADAIDAGGDPGEEATAARLRALPVFTTFDPAAVEVRELEIMLLTGSRTIARAVGDELRACGYRVVGASDPFQAIALAVRMRPDMVIASAVLDGLGGVDVAHALRAIRVTADMPLALLTSFHLSHRALRGLPAGVEVIRLGRFLSDDLARVLGRFDA